ncbi:hypothetical protein AB0N06_36065 [Streptomyces sp. NPDC051020]|uniref:hypothetical protein n=1 Tax=Streptomyces sp. NPDC051020 TaxID=3155409 RepID=UPI0034175D41
MFQETPIYRRLVAEQGDVPARVRGEAEQLHRDLAKVMPPGHRPVTTQPVQRGMTPWQGV